MRCIPCEYKAAQNKAKTAFLLEIGLKRAYEQNTDYVIYEDSEDGIYKLATFDEAIRRKERIVVNISRFEGVNT
jgi:hypothetical protein